MATNDNNNDHNNNTKKQKTMVLQKQAIIAPSLLSCDLANIASEATEMINLGADWLHMDIMVCVRERIFMRYYASD